MEENMAKNNETEVVKTGTANEPAQESSEKMFTQEQVNEMIKKRLKNQKEVEANAQEINTRAAELTARESRLNCREYLMEKGYPSELLDIIDTSDVETFKNKADKASRVFKDRQSSYIEVPLASTERPMYGDLSKAFENTKHEPRQYPPR